MPPTWCPCAATLQAPAALGPASVLVSGEDAQKSAPPGIVDEHTLPRRICAEPGQDSSHSRAFYAGCKPCWRDLHGH